MQIILLNLPWRENGRFGVRAGSRWPFTSRVEKDSYLRYVPFPFFLAYSTSLLKKKAKKVRLIDAIAEGLSEEKLMEEIKCYDPELIAVETSTPSFKKDIQIIRGIHQQLPNCQIALCGPHVSIFFEQILKEYNFINYILVGEYEYTLLELVNYLEGSLNIDSILGLVYREGHKIKINDWRPTIDDLNSLYWPERDDVPIYRYNDGFAGLPQPNVQMWTSRGCPFSCIFCLWPQTIYKEHRYRKRDPVDVVDEMEYLINRFNFKAIYFDDDVFNIDKNHVLRICEEIKRRKIDIPWAAMARADLMDEVLLESMAGAGLYAIKYGLESVNQKILNFCKKNMNLETAYKAIKFTKKLGIKVHLTFCLGLPGETQQTIEETVNFIQDIRPNSLQFSFATPFPGTEYFEYLEKKGYLLSKDWPDYDGNYKCILKTDELSSEDLGRIRIALNNNYNFQ